MNVATFLLRSSRRAAGRERMINILPLRAVNFNVERFPMSLRFNAMSAAAVPWQFDRQQISKPFVVLDELQKLIVMQTSSAARAQSYAHERNDRVRGR